MRVCGRDYRAVWWENGDVVVVDQTKLPDRFVLKRLRGYRQTAEAIRTMVVRGAGTIGATAAYGMAQAFRQRADLDEAYRCLLET
ncbi:MAG: S-methyl-5-thioribose-1-phosphate isomerase, partial [Verrucomicrobiae bacterium]|nr:S-methyl-5-thioribose-1-phosphate isomerase [Verrucomicrobiae bacterium]